MKKKIGLSSSDGCYDIALTVNDILMHPDFEPSNLAHALNCPLEDAAFIVRAVNTHEELLEALKALVADTECYCQNDKEVGLTGACPLHTAQEAIAKAQGQ